MSKLIKSGDEARKALEAGVNTLAGHRHAVVLELHLYSL